MTYPLPASTLDAILGDPALSPVKRLLLLVLESHASHPGQGVYPSLRLLADRSGLSLAHVCTLLPELATDGYLTIHHRQGPKGGNLYEVHLPDVPLSGAPESGTRTAGAPASGTELRSEREKIPILSQPEELQPEELQPVEHCDSPASSAVTEKAAQWLRTFEHDLKPGYAQVLQGTPPDDQATAPTPETPPPLSRAKTPRAPALYFQGKLCPGGHDDGTGHTLRRVKNGNCTECDVARTRAKRQAQAAARNASRVTPARQVIDLAAHRQAQGG